MELPTALILGADRVARSFAECSPSAPARPPRERRTRVRAALARGLIQLAHAVAPPEPVCR